MKNLRSVLVALAVLFMATAAHAQSKVATTIPFNFMAGDRAYPAGSYILSNDASVLWITGAEQTSVTLSNACERLTPSTTTKVVFSRMGGAYFLKQIWREGDSRGRELPRSKSEVRLAQNHEKSEPVIVAANIAK
jgi:hypothetical protein